MGVDKTDFVYLLNGLFFYGLDGCEPINLKYIIVSSLCDNTMRGCPYFRVPLFPITNSSLSNRMHYFRMIIFDLWKCSLQFDKRKSDKSTTSKNWYSKSGLLCTLEKICLNKKQKQNLLWKYILLNTVSVFWQV